MPDSIICLDHVSKTFRGRPALDRVTFDVQRGELLALVGHNGAGKSTLLALIVGLLRPTSGDVLVRGVSMRRDPRAARRGIGTMLAPAFHEHLSGWQNLMVFTSYSGGVTADAIADTVAFVGLTERIHDQVRGYSHGMTRRLALAQALLPLPDVVLLDEPEEGLDPDGIRDMRATIRRLNRERGVTVVLASHHLTGDDQTCDRMAILERGRLVFLGGWEDVETGPSVRLELDDWPRALPLLEQLGTRLLADGLVALGARATVPDVVATLVRGGIEVHAAEPVRRTLAELYARARAMDR